MCNGCIAGMVAICAGASTVYPWAAWVIGFIGGLVYKGISYLVVKAGIDDPIDAAAVSLARPIVCIVWHGFIHGIMLAWWHHLVCVCACVCVCVCVFVCLI